MPTRSQRHDSYGKPLPALVPSREKVRSERSGNGPQRQRLLTVLNEQIDVLLDRHITADVTLTFKVIEGMLQGNSLYVSVGRRYRAEEDF